MTTTEPGRRPGLTAGPVADTLRRLAVQGRDAAMGMAPAAPPGWVLEIKAELRAERIETARALGAVVWHPAEAGRPLTLVNIRTGARWARDELGDWRPRPATRATPVARRIGALLRELDDRVDAIAALLRQDIRPWRELLDDGAEAAIAAGGVRSWVRFGRDKVAELMYDTEPRPHRIVLVVDDAEAYAASWYADASAAADPVWAAYCRHQAGQAEARGEGEFPVDVHGDRAAAVLVLATLRGSGQRPGQSWRVEPVSGEGAQ